MNGLTPGFFSQQYFDNNGKILSGGKLYFYSAGSTSLKSIYENYSKTSSQTNPLILDSNGRADQYFLDTGLYDIKITDSLDNEIQTLKSVETYTGDMDSYPTPTASGYLYYDSDTSTYSWISASSLVASIYGTPAAASYLHYSGSAYEWVNPSFTSDHLLITSATDGTASYLINKIGASTGINIIESTGSYGKILKVVS